MTTHIICSHCGSTEVYADATASWDACEGEWIMSCVHDDRYCDHCGGEANLIEVDEAEGLEIGFYGMVKEGDNARLVQDHETPDFFDVMVRTTALESLKILALFEFDDQTRKEANGRLMFLTALFPDAPIDWHLGKQPQYKQKGKFFEVMREQWEAHKANAPETYFIDDVSDQFIAENDWEYFRYPIQLCATSGTGIGLTEYAISPITGVMRSPTLAEHCEIFGGDGW